MDDRFVSLLEQLAAKLGVQVELLVQAATLHVTLQAVALTLISVFVLACGVAALLWTNALRKDDEDSWVLVGVLSLIIIAAGLVATARNLAYLVEAFVNPLFLAVEAIKSM